MIEWDNSFGIFQSCEEVQETASVPKGGGKHCKSLSEGGPPVGRGGLFQSPKVEQGIKRAVFAGCRGDFLQKGKRSRAAGRVSRFDVPHAGEVVKSQHEFEAAGLPEGQPRDVVQSGRC